MLRPKLYTLLKNRPQEFTKKNLMRDITAGLVVACIALPLSIALAIASGVMPDKGLITAVFAGFIIAVLGGSRVQVAGPTGAFVIIVYGIIQQYGFDGLLLATMMAGIMLIIMGVLKFGAFLKFIPYPVTTGFTSGIAVVLFSTQINDFFGLGLSDIPSGFFAKWQMYIQNITAVNNATLYVGLLGLLIIIFWPKKLKFVPGSLVALLVTTVIVKVFGLNVATIASTFGDIKMGSIIPSLPSFNFDILVKLLRPAFTIAVLAGIESLLSAVVADGMIGKKHRSNMELVATGCGNIVSAMLGGLPATGAIARTAANIDNGGRTPIAAMAHSVFLLIMMLCLMPYISLIPMTSLAVILFVVAYKMSDWRSFVSLFKAPLSDILVLLTTFTLTVTHDLIVAIEFGLVLAAILFMRRMAEVYHIANLDDDVFDGARHQGIPGHSGLADSVTVYEINGPFFFGAANVFIDTLENIKDRKVLILQMRSVPAMDATGYHALYKIYKRCSSSGVKVLLCHVQQQPQKMLQKYGFTDIIGPSNMCKNMQAALARAQALIKDDANENIKT